MTVNMKDFEFDANGNVTAYTSELVLHTETGSVKIDARTEVVLNVFAKPMDVIVTAPGVKLVTPTAIDIDHFGKLKWVKP